MANNNKNSRPLFVDLDGTLISTDTLWESCLLYVKKYPFKSGRLILWLLKGTHQTEFKGMPATGNKFEAGGIIV